MREKGGHTKILKRRNMVSNKTEQTNNNGQEQATAFLFLKFLHSRLEKKILLKMCSKKLEKVLFCLGNNDPVNCHHECGCV